MRPRLLGTHIRQILATALVCGASFGYIALTDDSVSQSTAVYTPAPASGPTTYHGPSMSRNEASFSTRAVVPAPSHSMPGHATGGHAAASASRVSTSSFSNVNQPIGVIGSLTQPGSGSGGGGGGGSSSSAIGAGSGNVIAMAAPRIVGNAAAPIAIAPRAKVSQATLHGNPYGSLTVYDGDTPGVITGDENKDLDNPIVDNLTEPLGDALLPLLLCVVLYLLCKRKPLPEVISCITSRGKHHNIS